MPGPDDPIETKSPFEIHRREALFLAAILLAALFLRLAFFRGIVSTDDFNYLRHAAEVWKGRFDLSGALYLHATRPLVFIPPAWLFSAFGVSEGVAVAWPLLASTATVALVYLLAREWFDREHAVYAAVLASFLPMMVDEATRLLPGAIMNLVIAASAYCFVVSERVRSRRRLWLLISGLVYGGMQLAGEIGLLFGCFFLLAVLVWRRHSLWSYWPLAAGFAAAIAASVAYYWIATGDPLFKSAISQTILATEVHPFRPLYYLRTMLHPFAGQGGVFYLAAVGGLAALVGRRRYALLVLAWFVATWLLIEFASSSLSEYRPLYKYARYLSVASVPGTLLAAVGVVYLKDRIAGTAGRPGPARASASVVAVILLAAFATSMVTLVKAGRNTGELRSRLHAVRDQVRARRGQTIYVTHWLWNSRVGFYMGFSDEYMPSGYDPYHAVRLATADSTSMNLYVQTLESGARLASGLLVHDETLFAYSRGHGTSGSVGRGEIPEALAAVPDDWRLVERVAVGPRSTVALYEIPEGSRWPEPPRE